VDTLLRGISGDASVRVVTAITTQLVREACRRQRATGVRAVALGRAATAGCLLSTLAKNDQERVRIQLDGQGPVGRVIVDSRSNGRIRACFERAPASSPASEPEPLTLADGRATIGSAVGRDGLVVVTRDLGLENQYQGAVEMRSGEIDEDLQAYLDRSEQLPSALTCAVLLDVHGDVLRAGGVLCQTLPGSDPAVIETIRETLGHGSLRAVLQHERTPRELARFAIGGAKVEVMGKRTLVYHCPCGDGTAMRVLSTLGPDDLEALALEREQTEVSCHFCGNCYVVAAPQLRELARVLRRGMS
jgi:molecular chaperone Hsp33